MVYTDYNDNHSTYAPYSGTGEQMPDLMQALLRMINPNAGLQLGGGTFNSPYSNLHQQEKSRQSDQVYREMLSAATSQHAEQLRKIVTSISSTQQFAGQPITPGQQGAISNAMHDLATRGVPLLTQTPGGRRFLDWTAEGGNAQANTTAAFADNWKMLTDPTTGMPKISSANGQQVAAAAHRYLFGGTAAENRVQAQGFHAEDVYATSNYLARRGALVDGGLERNLSKSQSLRDAMASGRLTQEDLDRIGVGDLDMMQGGDKGAVEAVNTSVGNRAGRAIKGAFTSMAAMKELMGPAGKDLLMGSSELINRMEEFTQQYNSQMSGTELGTLMRRTTAAFTAMGHDWQDIAKSQNYAANVLASQGYRGGATQYALNAVAPEMQGIVLAGGFTSGVYGSMSAGETEQNKYKLFGQYGKSTQAATLATILGRFRDIGERTKGPGGDELKALARNIEEGVPLGDRFNEMLDNGTLMQWAGERMAGDDNLERMRRDMMNPYLTERRVVTNRIGESFMQENQRRNFVNRGSATFVAEALSNKLTGVTDSASMISGIGRELGAELMSMDKATGDDDKMRNEKLAARMHRYLTEQSAAGNTDAGRTLSNYGKTEAEQLANMADSASVYSNQIMGEYRGPIGDILNQMGDQAIEKGRVANAKSRIQGEVAGFLADSTNDERKDVGRTLAGRLTAMATGGITMDKFAEGLDEVLKTSASETTKEQVENAIDRIKGWQKQFADPQGDNEPDAEYRKRKQHITQQIEKETGYLGDLLKDTEAAAKAKEEAEKAKKGESANGEQGGGATFNNLTFNFGDEVLVQIQQAKSQASLPNSTGDV